MSKKIGVLGGGLVGSLISILLVKEGYHVEVFEKRPDPRDLSNSGGRSINLALSHRGIRTLKMAGVFESIEPLLIPMYGRMVHTNSSIDFQPYGRRDQYINSVSRHQLNTLLITKAEEAGVRFYFEENIEDIRPENAALSMSSGSVHSFDFLIGADGAFSSLRKKISEKDSSHNSSEEKLSHSYKELTIPAFNDQFAMDPLALHIWPRKNFMLIALPNTDHSFTCTLFLGDRGDPSFEQLDSQEKIRTFLQDSFPDVIPLLEDPIHQFQSNPTSSLQTIKTFPWAYQKSLLIGDAAHAIVPFYGQGMNAGFEDCRIFVELLQASDHDWARTAQDFQLIRKKDADAIAELALRNFLEMREGVIDESFLKRKQLEKRLNGASGEWLPLYSMVTFSDLPYHKALKLGELQDHIIKDLGENYDPKTLDLIPLLEDFKKLKQVLD